MGPALPAATTCCPNCRLSGWTPDWYAGFPAYQFYMVVPSLLIVALHVGLPWYLAVPVRAAGASALVLAAWVVPAAVPVPADRCSVVGGGRDRARRARSRTTSPSSWSRSLGLVALPVGVLGLRPSWPTCRSRSRRWPRVAALFFIYNREPLFNSTGNIIGGNIASTMAGEFAFSISLTLAVLYLGRGRPGPAHRPAPGRWPPALFALAGLCHLIPAFFVLGLHRGAVPVAPGRARLKWLATMVPVAGLLTAFWVAAVLLAPRLRQRHGLGEAPGAGRRPRRRRPEASRRPVVGLVLPAPLGHAVADGGRGRSGVAGVGRPPLHGRAGAGRPWVGVIGRRSWSCPQARLWNARLLPFMYLSVALLAAIGVGEVIRVAGSVASGRAERPLRPVTVGRRRRGRGRRSCST